MTLPIQLEGRRGVSNVLICTESDNLKARSHKDIAIETQRPIVDIPKIVRNPLGHLFKATRFAPQSINLRPTGYSGLDVIAKYIFCDQPVIFIVMRKRMRSRSNQRHITFEDVEELRQLVNTCATQQSPNPCHAIVVLPHLSDARPIFEDRHCTKLEDDELNTVKPAPPLPEYDSARAVEFDCNRNGNKQRRQKDDRPRSKNNIERAFDPPLDPNRSRRRTLALNGNGPRTRRQGRCAPH